MSLLADALGGSLGGLGGFGLAHYWDKLNSNGYTPPPAKPIKPLMASDVALAEPLKAPLSGINKSGQNSLSSALGTLENGARKSSTASGRVRGDYVGQALGKANTLASRGVEDAVGGTLGGASLQDTQNEREFEANKALAEEIGGLMSPTILQEIISGINGAAGTGLQFKGLYDALGKGGKDGGSGGSSLSPRLSLLDPNAYGYVRYS